MYVWISHFSPLNLYSYRDLGLHTQPIMTIFPAHAFLLICILIIWLHSLYILLYTNKVTISQDDWSAWLSVSNMHKKMLKKFFVFYFHCPSLFCPRKESGSKAKGQKGECSTLDPNVSPFFCSSGKGGDSNTGYLACSTGKLSNSWRVFPRWYYIFRRKTSCKWWIKFRFNHLKLKVFFSSPYPSEK